VRVCGHHRAGSGTSAELFKGCNLNEICFNCISLLMVLSWA
jgi:hypothetical protein